jgi:hypothetical protein
LRFAGKQFPVYRRAIKACDTANWTGMHRMHNAVHLEGLRCDGSAHGGCQAGCLLYWNEDWVQRVEPGEALTETAPDPSPRAGVPNETDLSVPPAVARGTTRSDGMTESAEVAFSCQATELTKAAPECLAWWDVRTYVRDVASKNARALPMIRGLLVMLFNKFQLANNRYMPRLQLIRNGEKWPFLAGRLTKTPMELLDLQPGELVEIKSKQEILETLDNKSMNRGLRFDGEQLKYCGQRARVLRRVERIIDESTGKMLHFKGDCIVLEGVTCTGTYNQYCPRSIYPYWREIWLRRVDEESAPPMARRVESSSKPITVGGR